MIITIIHLPCLLIPHSSHHIILLIVCNLYKKGLHIFTHEYVKKGKRVMMLLLLLLLMYDICIDRQDNMDTYTNWKSNQCISAFWSALTTRTARGHTREIRILGKYDAHRLKNIPIIWKRVKRCDAFVMDVMYVELYDRISKVLRGYESIKSMHNEVVDKGGET